MKRFSTFKIVFGLMSFALLGFSGTTLSLAPQGLPASLHPTSYTTQSGGSGGQPVSNLNTMDETGTSDNPAHYISFTTPSVIYQGYRRYFLPTSIAPGKVTSLRVKVNYKGPAVAAQMWRWYLFDWKAKKWSSIGNNQLATANRWTLLIFNSVPAGNFINSTTREIRLLLQSNNATGNAKLDYESITLGYYATPTVTRTPTKTPTPTATPSSVHFAVIGDYGADNTNEAAVATLVKSKNPNFIITTGDNNYFYGETATIDQNIGKYYHEYIYPYTGTYGAGSQGTNRFFPALGNHDWASTTGANPYLAYFTLPGNERYYEFGRGPVHFFVLDSDPHEPDGTSDTSTQAVWLQSRLAAASEPWKVVYMHHPPYSSSSVHGSTPYMQWDFKGWGADVVLAGHDHTYERLDVGAFPYFVNGLGGQTLYTFGTPVPGSQVRYSAQYGAMLVDATATQITFQFIGVDGTVVDTYTLP